MPIFLNAAAGIGSPYWTAKSSDYFCYFSESSQHARLEFKAVIESVIFLLNINFKLLRLRHRSDVSQLIFTGGLSNSSAIAQCIADLSGYDVLISAEKEASAKSAFCFLTSAAIDMQIETSFRPQATRSVTALQKRFEVFEHCLQRYVNL